MTTKYDSLEELAKNATPGPWAAPARPGVMTTMVTDAGGKNVADVGFRVTPGNDMANGRFIAAARTAVPTLIADVKMLAEALRKAEQLAGIADDWNLNEVEIDGVMVPTLSLWQEFRAALKRIQGEAG